MKTLALALAAILFVQTLPAETIDGYPTVETKQPETPWSTWSQKPTIFALLSLMKIRDSLLNKNLFSTIDFSKLPQETCLESVKFVRTVDGRCNSLETPLMGVAGMPFGRNIPLAKVKKPTVQEIMDPNPRLISRTLLTRKTFKPLTNLNVLGVAWLQFMVHDWINHKKSGYDTDSIFEIPLDANDPLGVPSLIVPKTSGFRTSDGAAIYPNTETAWWDGSQVYGSDIKTHKKLRAFVGGKMRVDEKGNLPRDLFGQEEVGVNENWWLGLSLMHTLFVKEHNRIAEALQKAYPTWDDQKLFDVARLINAAVMAKIQVVEWTPQVHQNGGVKMGMNSTWNGLFNLGATLKTVVGGKNDLRNVPYSLTEEFVAAYRFHPFLPEAVTITSLNKSKTDVSVGLANMRNQQSAELIDSVGTSNLIYSFAKATAGAQTLNNYPNFLQDLSMPVIGKMDLGAVEIIRDRERGVPRYNEFRRLLQLKPIKKFEDLTTDPEKLANLKSVYRNDIELIDLMVGAMAEDVRPDGVGFSETFFQIFTFMTPRRLEADRFFTTDYRPEVYTQLGMDWIKKSDFKSILLRHYPELANKLPKSQKVFAPWVN